MKPTIFSMNTPLKTGGQRRVGESTASSAQIGANRMTLKPRYATNIRARARAARWRSSCALLNNCWVRKEQRHALVVQPRSRRSCRSRSEPMRSRTESTPSTAAAQDGKMADPLACISIRTRAPRFPAPRCGRVVMISRTAARDCRITPRAMSRSEPRPPASRLREPAETDVFSSISRSAARRRRAGRSAAALRRELAAWPAGARGRTGH